jgi:Fur family transcriptional regulator, ferric uptake regulator
MASKPAIRLDQFGLRSTGSRQAVLAAFQKAGYALSQGDIEQALSNEFDRVTIYRTLKSFLASGLLHKVLDDQGSIKYALCHDMCHQETHTHQHDHVHFKCTQCGQTTCLETVHIPQIILPEYFVKQESNLLIQGVCRGCNS